LESNLIQDSIRIARINWNAWHEVFEHDGSIVTNPVLADEAKFIKFLREYSVGRTIRKGTRNKFRHTLINSCSFQNAINDDSGKSLVNCERELRPKFGTHVGANHITSALSKIAAFLRPDRFVAWDKFAKRGINIVLDRGVSYSYNNNYSEYLAAFDYVWNGPLGQEIRKLMESSAMRAVEQEPRFQRRIVDFYLVELGKHKREKRKSPET
jgi:hypothetical protein